MTPSPFPRVAMQLELLPVVGNESTDLEVDSLGRVHVVSNYVGAPDGSVDYSVRELDGGWWTERIVGSVLNQPAGTGVKLELDSADQPHVAFVMADLPGNSARTRLFYAWRTDAGWQREELEDAGFQISVFFGFTLANDVPHVAYRVRNAVGPDGGGLLNVERWGSRTNGAWTLETLEQFPDRSTATTVAVTADGVPHVFYRGLDAGTNVARHASRTAPNVWAFEDLGFSQVSSAWAANVGNDLTVGMERSLYRRTNGVWREQPSANEGNQVVVLPLPSGEVWDFSHGGTSLNRALRTGRTVNGQHDTSLDAGLEDTRLSGWGYDVTTGSIWGSVYRTPATGTAGIYVVKLP